MTRFLNSVDISTRADTEAQGALIGTVTTMPAASIYNVGCTVFYAGTTGTYDSGCLYTCVQSGASYKWEKTAVLAQGLELDTADRAVITDASGRVIAAGVTSAELGYLSGVTSGLQTQLNGKVPTSRTINGKALTSDIVLSASDIGAAPSSGTLAASRALQTSTNGEVEVSNVTSVELSYLSGVTSAIQDQIDGKADQSDIPTLLSQLTNDTGFITNAVSDLVNYYTKDETYTRAEISNMISAIPKFSIQVVQSLPSSGISTTTIYLTPSDGGSGNSYSEYIYVNNTWELIGSTAVDLSDYYTKAQVNAMVTPVQSTTGITINGVGLQEATSGQPGLMTVAQVGQLATAVSNAQSALNGNVTGGTLSTDTSGNLTLTLNRTAGALSVGPAAITAARSVADGSGNNIASTYATQSALTSGLAGKADAGTEITGGAFSNNILTLNKADGTGVDIPLPESISEYDISVDMPQFTEAGTVSEISTPIMLVEFINRAENYYTAYNNNILKAENRYITVTRIRVTSNPHFAVKINKNEISSGTNTLIENKVKEIYSALNFTGLKRFSVLFYNQEESTYTYVWIKNTECYCEYDGTTYTIVDDHRVNYDTRVKNYNKFIILWV